MYSESSESSSRGSSGSGTEGSSFLNENMESKGDLAGFSGCASSSFSFDIEVKDVKEPEGTEDGCGL